MNLLQSKALSGKEGNAWRFSFLLIFLWCIAGCGDNVCEEFYIPDESNLITKGTSEDNAIVTAVTTKKNISFDVKRDGDIVVDWGDGTQNTNVFQHNYTNNGSHTIKFYGSEVALTHFSSMNSGLTALDVSKSLALDSLNCVWNQLTTLDVSQQVALRYLYCGQNSLTAIDVSNNTELINLACFDCQLTNLDVTNNTKLEELNCSQNQLTTLDISGQLNLRILYCMQNNIANLDISKNRNLTEIECSNNLLANLELNNHPNLVYLHCADNRLNALNVSYCPNIFFIRCYNNPFTDSSSELISFANSLPDRMGKEVGSLIIVPWDMVDIEPALIVRPIAESKNWRDNVPH